MDCSIIIPSYNNAQSLAVCLQALLEQETPKIFEILIIDNGSDVPLKDELKAFNSNNIRWLKEYSFLGSPYSARNRGIEAASADWIFFLDATCLPAKDWLETTLSFAKLQKLDLVASNVVYDVDDSATTAEIYDALLNIDNHYSVTNRNTATTASLLVHKKVIDNIGLFPEGLRSGGDVRLTGKATAAGFKLGYCEQSLVYKKPRDRKAIIKKAVRVATGQVEIWKEQKKVLSYAIKSIARLFLPPNLFSVLSKSQKKCFPLSKYRAFKVWMFWYSIRIKMTLIHLSVLSGVNLLKRESD